MPVLSDVLIIKGDKGSYEYGALRGLLPWNAEQNHCTVQENVILGILESLYRNLCFERSVETI